MTLTNIYGDVGTGKTLLATVLGIMDGREIYANYTIHHPRAHKIEPQDLVSIEDGIVILDESYMWLEARTSAKNLNRYISYILFQSRKRKQEYILTEQLFGTVDLRFREMSDYIILADRDEKGNFVYSVYRNSNTKPEIRRFCIDKSHVEEIGVYYDTDEQIPISPDLIADSVIDKRDLLPEVDDIIERMFQQNPLQKYWTKAAVSDWCLRNGYAKLYVDLVFNGIRARRIN